MNFISLKRKKERDGPGMVHCSAGEGEPLGEGSLPLEFRANTVLLCELKEGEWSWKCRD